MFNVIAKMAWASLKRRKSRSLLVVLMIAISLWGLLAMEGIYDGMTEQMINNAIRSGSGDITMFAKGYRLENDLQKLIMEVDEVRTLLQNDKRVKTWVMRLKQDGLIATAHYSRNATIYGVDLAAEKKHGRLDEYLYQGDFSFGKKNKGAIIGARLAEKLKITIGKKIVISAQNIDNDVASAAFKVTGIIKTNNMALDETAVFLDLGKARTLLQIPTGITQVCMILTDEDHITELTKELTDRFQSLEIFSWDQIYPALMQSRVMMQGFNLVTSLIIFCIAALGIFGVMLVSVLERLREFGVMLAIGTKFTLICKIVLLESCLLGLSGFLGGTILGGGTLYYFYIHGLDLTIFSEGLDAFGMDAITYALIRPSYFYTAMMAVTVASLLSVVFPLRTLQKAKPMECIRKL